MSKPGDGRPLVVHVLHRFDTGGLENGVVNLINHMPEAACRHAVVALTEFTDFARRITRPDVKVVALGKGPGQGAKVWPRLYRLLRQWRPAVVHTRNLAALEMQPAAWAARVPVRIHGEHGRDVDDPDGTSAKHQRIRRLYAPFVQRWVALSQDLAGYLTGPVGIPAARVTQIYNGVDTLRFHPAPGGCSAPAPIPGCPFDPARHWLVGTVGRLAPIKNQPLLAQAFVAARAQSADFAARGRLVIAGSGPLHQATLAVLRAAGAEAAAWLPGERADVPDVMRGLNCFVLPSLGEGISNTILEAMATGLPVVATRVGGNAELVSEGRTGTVVASGDAGAIAAGLLALASNPGRAGSWGAAGRAEVERRFSLQAMVAAYQALYTAAGR